MNKLLITMVCLLAFVAVPAAGKEAAAGKQAVDPDADLQAYIAYFEKRFPDFTSEDYTLGAYRFNEDKKAQWEEIMDFPPYENNISDGEELFNTPFKNGKTFADCFENGGQGIAHTYPRFDPKDGKVKNLSVAVNECREANGEEPLDLLKGELPSILAYMAESSRGKPIDIEVPETEQALAAYQDGKQTYFTRRGPLAFACYHCHWEAAGANIRGNELSPARGQGANFPAYRSKWGDFSSIQRRYKGCMNNTGAKPLKPGSPAMNNLEYFHRRLSNGLPYNAPNNRF